MGCNCRVTEAVIAVVVLVFTFWNNFVAAKWLVAIAAVLLLIHSIWCNACCEMPAETKKSAKKRK
ncbi:MAG TPA: hypothetical protein VHA12_02265 [Candidatus Nanoarchaeia archaeon]|nr:hypothetical protein [Candidatus Nanoarchaeia archaeon]